MKQAKRLLALALVVLMIASFAACGGESGSSASSAASSSAASSSAAFSSAASSSASSSSTEDPNAPKKGGTLKLADYNAITSLWYNSGVSQNCGFIIKPAMQALVYNDFEYNAHPLLCESLTRDDKALTLTIKLKEGIKFHDGSTLDADCVKWNIDTFIDNGVSSSIGSPIKCEKTDNMTVVLTYEKFSLDWEYNLGTCYIYSYESFKEKGNDYYINNLCGTGPFKMDEYKIDNIISFSRFDDYFGDKAYLDGISYIHFADANAEAIAFINKEIDYYMCWDDVSIKMIEEAGYVSKHELFHNDSSTAPYIWINTIADKLPDGSVNPWNDVKVRQAVVLWGLNYDEIAFGCKGKAASHYYQYAIADSWHFDADAEKEYHFDLQKAKDMLKDAGYPNGFDTTITSHVSTVNEATAMQSAFKDLGINAKVDNVTSVTSMRDEGTIYGFAITMSGVGINYVKSFYNFKRQFAKIWKMDDKYNQLCEDMNNATTRDIQKQKVKELSKYMTFEQTFFAQLYQINTMYYVQDHFRGIEEATKGASAVFYEYYWNSDAK